MENGFNLSILFLCLLQCGCIASAFNLNSRLGSARDPAHDVSGALQAVDEALLPSLDFVLPEAPRRRRKKHKGKGKGRTLEDEEEIFKDAEGFHEVKRIGRIKRKHKLAGASPGEHHNVDLEELSVL